MLFSVGDSRYGIDIDQIALLTNFVTGQLAVSFSRLMKEPAPLYCHNEKMLLIKQRTELPILINEPDSLTVCRVCDICRLPQLLAAAAGKRGVWGFLPQDQGIIILIDLYKNQLFERLIKYQLAIRKGKP
ncbi:MAG: hypothetical protein LLG02_12580 [Pelosinus sp.]|nr:hypothetical protein [Pelosinus sp.]